MSDFSTKSSQEGESVSQVNDQANVLSELVHLGVSDSNSELHQPSSEEGLNSSQFKKSRKPTKKSEDVESKLEFKNVVRMGPQKLIKLILLLTKTENHLNSPPFCEFIKLQKSVKNLDDIRSLLVTYEETDLDKLKAIIYLKQGLHSKQTNVKKNIRDLNLIKFDHSIQFIKDYIRLEKSPFVEETIQCIENVVSEMEKIDKPTDNQKLAETIPKIQKFIEFYNYYIKQINRVTVYLRTQTYKLLLGCQDHNYFWEVKLSKKWIQKKQYAKFAVILANKLIEPESLTKLH